MIIHKMNGYSYLISLYHKALTLSNNKRIKECGFDANHREGTYDTQCD